MLLDLGVGIAQRVVEHLKARVGGRVFLHGGVVKGFGVDRDGARHGTVGVLLLRLQPELDERPGGLDLRIVALTQDVDAASAGADAASVPGVHLRQGGDAKIEAHLLGHGGKLAQGGVGGAHHGAQAGGKLIPGLVAGLSGLHGAGVQNLLPFGQ